MKSNNNTPSNIGDIDFSPREKEILKAYIEEQIKAINIESVSSVGLFFNTIQLFYLSHLPYSQKHIESWNRWIRVQKENCIQGVKSNSNKMPTINIKSLQDFMNILIQLELMIPLTEANRATMKDIQAGVYAIMDPVL